MEHTSYHLGYGFAWQCGNILASDETSRRDEVANHSKIIIIALTLAAWWLQLRQYFTFRLMKGQHRDVP